MSSGEEFPLYSYVTYKCDLSRRKYGVLSKVFNSCFGDQIRVPRIREIGCLQSHTRYLTFSFKKNCFIPFNDPSEFV